MGIININSIKKTFGDYTAVDGVSFDVAQGTIFGLLGPNGAGKTTTIRMITNIIIPDEGKITIDGLNNGYDTQSLIGYLPEERGLYKKLKVIEQLKYFAQLKGVNAKDAEHTAMEWLVKLGAGGWENKKIQELSKGMQQKVQFIATILHDPKILILDEPFSGFDPINTEMLKSIILDMKSRGKTIILSTHVMSQVEQLCDDIVIINKGKIIVDGKVSEIKARYGEDTVIIEFDGDSSVINDIPDIRITDRSNHRIEFRLGANSPKASEILKDLVNKIDIIRFEKVQPSLHEIFITEVAKQKLGTKEANNEN
jgi:ABC-2 type transport system ATP-binding protein